MGENTKIPVYENRAAGAILGDSGPLWPILGFSGLFLSKYAVSKDFLALKISCTVTISCKRVPVRYSYEVIMAVKSGEKAVNLGYYS